jgi:hypothetical protein
VKLVVDPLPGAVALPHREIMIEGIPLRHVVRQQSPRASCAQHVPDAVQDLAPLVLRRPATALGLWHGIFDQRILEVAQVTRMVFVLACASANPPSRPVLFLKTL